MKILVLGNPRTGTKFFQMSLAEKLKEEYGDIAYLKLPYIEGDAFSLGELFNLDYMHMHMGNILEDENGKLYCYTVNEVEKNVLTISQSDDVSMAQYDKFVSHCFDLTKALTLPYVVKIHFSSFKDRAEAELHDWIHDNIDLVVCTTRTNHIDWAISTSILHESTSLGKHTISATQYRCDNFNQTTTIAELAELESRTLNFYNKLNIEKVMFDVSNLPEVLTAGQFQFGNSNRTEFRNNNDYSKLRDLVK